MLIYKIKLSKLRVWSCSAIIGEFNCTIGDILIFGLTNFSYKIKMPTSVTFYLKNFKTFFSSTILINSFWIDKNCMSRTDL